MVLILSLKLFSARRKRSNISLSLKSSWLPLKYNQYSEIWLYLTTCELIVFWKKKLGCSKWALVFVITFKFNLRILFCCDLKKKKGGGLNFKFNFFVLLVWFENNTHWIKHVRIWLFYFCVRSFPWLKPTNYGINNNINFFL